VLVTAFAALFAAVDTAAAAEETFLATLLTVEDTALFTVAVVF
jgi:hypothetical protein